MYLIYRIALVGFALNISLGCQTVPPGYVYLEGVRNNDLGFFKRSQLYEQDWTDLGLHNEYLGNDRLVYQTVQGRPTYSAVITGSDGADYILLMQRAGGTLGFTEPLWIDVFDSNFRHVRSGEAYGPHDSTPYALVYAMGNSERLPETFNNTWRLCVAFARKPIDTDQPIVITSYDNHRDTENDATIWYLEWDDDPVRLPRSAITMRSPGLPRIKNAEPGMEITPEGRVIATDRGSGLFGE